MYSFKPKNWGARFSLVLAFILIYGAAYAGSDGLNSTPGTDLPIGAGGNASMIVGAGQQVPVGSVAFLGSIGIGTSVPDGNLQIMGAKGAWSAYNYGKQLLVTTTNGNNNPAVGISDYTGSNWWAIANNAGNLFFNIMPPLGDSSSSATTVLFMSADGNVGIGTGTQTPVSLLDVGHLSTYEGVTWSNDVVNVSGTINVQNYDSTFRTTDPMTGHPFHLIGTYHGWDRDSIYIAGYNAGDTSNRGKATSVSFGGWGDGSFVTAFVDLIKHRVGIGTVGPASALDVVGEVKIGNSGAECTAALQGAMRYDGAMKYCNGSSWTTIGNPPITCNWEGKEYLSRGNDQLGAWIFGAWLTCEDGHITDITYQNP